MLNRKSSNFDKKLNCDKNYCDFAYLKKILNMYKEASNHKV